MQVIESGDQHRRYYLNDFLIQNSYDAHQHRSLSLFTELLTGLSEAYTPSMKKALCLGMGVGIVPMRLARSGLHVEIVEINPAVVPLAQTYFDFDPSKVQLVIDDARHFLATSHGRYDTIHLDAFVGDSMPSHLMTQEAFQAIHHRLEPNGTLVINSFVSFTAGRDFLGTSLYRTLKSVFKEVVIHASDTGNVFYVASDRTPLLPVRTPRFEEAHESRYTQVRATYANRVEVSSTAGMVLTDDYNPADFRDATNREELRKRLAQSVIGL
jgi:spermidine synthase